MLLVSSLTLGRYRLLGQNSLKPFTYVVSKHSLQ